MVVEEIKRNKLYLSNGEIIDISPRIKQNYTLKIGIDISEYYDEIVYAAALEKGIFLLSLRDRTKKEIKQKLNEKYKSIKSVCEAVEKLVELGYINDLEYAINYIKGKRFGRKRLEYELRLRGISGEIIDEAYENIDENEMDSKDIDEKKLEKAILKNIKKEESKLIQYLMRQGFSYSKIVSKLWEYKENNSF